MKSVTCLSDYVLGDPVGRRLQLTSCAASVPCVAAVGVSVKLQGVMNLHERTVDLVQGHGVILFKFEFAESKVLQ
jgi:hypothetical protein